MKLFQKYVYTWAPPILLMICIFILSSRQSVEVSETYVLNFIFFKMLHVMEYALLFSLLLRAVYLNNKTRKMQLSLFIIAFVLTVLYACSDEIHQLFVPTRQGTVRDVFIDSLGALGMWFIITHWFGRIKRIIFI